MPQYNIFKDSDIDPLGEGLFNVLEKVGVLIQNEEILQAVGRFGGKIDTANERVLIPRDVSRRLLETLRDETTKHPATTPDRFRAPSPPTIDTQIAQLYYDYATGDRRGGNSKDFVSLIKLGVALHPDVPVGHSLLLTDVPASIEPLHAALLMAEYAPDSVGAFAWRVDQVDVLREMGDILGKPDWFSWGATCFAHPLRFDKDVTDKFVRRAKEGSTCGLTAMPIAGATTPITMAGFVAVAGAEMFATWLAARAVNPEVPLNGSIWGGSLDMKTGEASYSSFDGMFYAFCLEEFLRKWCGMAISVGGGEYSDARHPGYYAAYEKAYKAMTIATFTGQHPGIGQGMLEIGKTISPVQLLLERDLTTGAAFYGRTVDTSPDALCMDEIVDVGFGIDKSYLATETTLREYRQHLWCPAWMERDGWRGVETDTKVLDRLQQEVNDLIASYKKPDVDPGTLAEMRRVIDRANKA